MYKHTALTKCLKSLRNAWVEVISVANWVCKFWAIHPSWKLFWLPFRERNSLPLSKPTIKFHYFFTYIMMTRTVKIRMLKRQLYLWISQCHLITFLLNINRFLHIINHAIVHNIPFQTSGSQPLLLLFIRNNASIMLQRIRYIRIIVSLSILHRLAKVAEVNTCCVGIDFTFVALEIVKWLLHIFTWGLYFGAGEDIRLFLDGLGAFFFTVHG